jgi:hypothetical protein
MKFNKWIITFLLSICISLLANSKSDAADPIKVEVKLSCGGNGTIDHLSSSNTEANIGESVFEYGKEKITIEKNYRFNKSGSGVYEMVIKFIFKQKNNPSKSWEKIIVLNKKNYKELYPFDGVEMLITVK